MQGVAPVKRRIHGKLLRWSMLAVISSAFMVLAACQQNPADPNPKFLENAGYRVPTLSLVPDSAAWWLRGSTGDAPIAQSPGTTQITSVFEMATEPGSDTLFLTNWTSGLRTSRFAFTGYGVLDPHPNRTIWEHPAREILERRDSLASIDPKFYSSNNQGARRAYADGLVAGDAKFSGYPSNTPDGIDSSILLDDIAIALVRKKAPFASIVTPVYLSVDSGSWHRRLVALHNAKAISDDDFAIIFATAPVRVVAALAMDSLLANGGAMTLVTGRFYAQRGVDNLTFSVMRNGVDATDLFKITDGVVLTSDPQDVDLAGKVFLETKATTTPGSYELQAIARDPQGYQVLAKRSFQVYAVPDRIGPDIQILWPATGTMLENDQTTTAVKAQIDDLSGVDTVTIGGQLARFDGKFWSVTNVAVPETDQGHPITVVAKDRLGNTSTATVMVGRKLSPFTTNIVLTPTQGAVLPFDSVAVKVRWKVRSRIGFGDTGVFIGGVPAIRESDSVWSARVFLYVGSNTIAMKAVDAQGNWTTNSVVVTRQAGAATVIRVTPKQDTVVSASTTSLRVSWRVPGADTVCINGNCSISRGGDSSFSTIVALQPGLNVVKLQSWANGGFVGDSIRITRQAGGDAIPPAIVRNASTRDTTVSASVATYTPAWTVTDNVAVSSVTINGVSVIGSAGVYTRAISLATGANRIVIVARDSAGNTSSDSILVTRLGGTDSTKPVVVRDSTTRSQTVSNATTSINLGWTVTDASALTVKLNDSAIAPIGSYYRRNVYLAVGSNVFRLVATDASGNVSRDSVVITRLSAGDAMPPVIVRQAGTKDTTVANAITSFTTTWKVTDNVAVSAVTINGASVVGVAGVYSRTHALVVGANRIAIVARDSAGNYSSDSVTIVRGAAGGDSTRPVIVVDTATRSQTVPNSTSSMNLFWTVTDASALTVRLNDSIVVPAAGLYRKNVFLNVGVNVFRIVATDAAGNVARDSVVITRQSAADVVAPVITRVVPVRDTSVTDPIFPVFWTVTDNVGVASVTINGIATTGSAGTYSQTVNLVGGLNVVKIVARDAAGNVSSDTVRITRLVADTTRPVIVVDTATRSQTVPNSTSSMNLFWTVSDASALTVRLNDSIVTPTAGLYRKSVALNVGVNVFRIVATDAAGNVSRDSVVITRRSAADVTPPVLTRVTPSKDTTVQGTTSSYTVSWKATDNVGLVSVTINGSAVVPVGGAFSRALTLSAGGNTVVVVARDSAGNTAKDSVVVTRASSSDVTPPTISRSGVPGSPLNIGQNPTASISAYISDNDAVASVTIGGTLVVGSYGNYTQAVTVAAGMNTVLIVATDRSGNVARDTIRFEARLYDAYYNSYKIVTIGSKTWMAQNLQIPAASGATGICIGSDCANNGRMYTLSQAATVCPTGWHLPTDLEWKALVTAAAAGSSDSVGATRLRTTSGWTGMNADSSTYSFNGSNATGFSLAPTDKFVQTIAKYSLGAFWTATASSPMAAFGRTFSVGSAISDASGIRTSAAVRCVMN